MKCKSCKKGSIDFTLGSIVFCPVCGAKHNEEKIGLSAMDFADKMAVTLTGKIEAKTYCFAAIAFSMNKRRLEVFLTKHTFKNSSGFIDSDKASVTFSTDTIKASSLAGKDENLRNLSVQFFEDSDTEVDFSTDEVFEMDAAAVNSRIAHTLKSYSWVKPISVTEYDALRALVCNGLNGVYGDFLQGAGVLVDAAS